MALFKVFRGKENKLNNVPLHDGYAYFTEDGNNLYIDVGNNPGDRRQVNAHYAKALAKSLSDGSVIELDVDKLYTKDEIDANSTTTVFNATLTVAKWTASGNQFVQEVTGLTNLKCGKSGTVPPLITYSSNQEEYSNIVDALATPGQKIVFTAKEKPANDIGIIIIDNR